MVLLFVLGFFKCVGFCGNIIPLFILFQSRVLSLLYEYEGSNCCRKCRVFPSELFGVFLKSLGCMVLDFR